jgi:hypothetical protein
MRELKRHRISREVIKCRDQGGKQLANTANFLGGHMENLEQLKKAVAEAGAEVAGIERGPKGVARLVIRTPGGLITIGVPLKGELSRDIENATAAANKIVASAKVLGADPARHLSASSGQKRQP